MLKVCIFSKTFANHLETQLLKGKVQAVKNPHASVELRQLRVTAPKKRNAFRIVKEFVSSGFKFWSRPGVSPSVSILRPLEGGIFHRSNIASTFPWTRVNEFVDQSVHRFDGNLKLSPAFRTSRGSHWILHLFITV
jgi:hypothetical protein